MSAAVGSQWRGFLDRIARIAGGLVSGPFAGKEPGFDAALLAVAALVFAIHLRLASNPYASPAENFASNALFAWGVLLNIYAAKEVWSRSRTGTVQIPTWRLVSLYVLWFVVFVTCGGHVE